MITYPEIYYQVSKNFYGSKTAEEIKQDADAIFNYITKNSSSNEGQKVVQMDEMWLVYAPDKRRERYEERVDKDFYYRSHANFA